MAYDIMNTEIKKGVNTMTFATVTTVKITKEEKENLTRVITFITSLTDKMRETSLFAVGCQECGDIYYVELNELDQIKFTLDMLKNIQNIC